MRGALVALVVAINPDRREAIEDARTTVSFYASAREYAPFFEAHGFGEEVRRIHERVERMEELEPALDRSLASGKPAVIHVQVDRDLNTKPPGWEQYRAARATQGY